MSYQTDAAKAAGRIEALTEAIEIVKKETWRPLLIQNLQDLLTKSLEDLPPPDSGPETSKKAAKSMVVRAGSLRHRALLEFSLRDLTDEECGNRMNHQRIWPRCSELRSLGLIKPTLEQRICARTKREVQVFTITPEGRAVLGTLVQGEAVKP